MATPTATAVSAPNPCRHGDGNLAPWAARLGYQDDLSPALGIRRPTRMQHRNVFLNAYQPLPELDSSAAMLVRAEKL